MGGKKEREAILSEKIIAGCKQGQGVGQMLLEVKVGCKARIGSSV